MKHWNILLRGVIIRNIDTSSAKSQIHSVIELLLIVLAIDLFITMFLGFLGIFPIATTLLGLLGFHIPWHQILTATGKALLAFLLIIIIAIFGLASLAWIKQSLCSHVLRRKDECIDKCVKCDQEFHSHDWNYSEDGHSKTCTKCHRFDSDGWTTEPDYRSYRGFY